MRTPDFDADPEEEPYTVLGVNPKAGPDRYLPPSEIRSRAQKLSRDNRDDEEAYRKIQLALRAVEERHPDRSSRGVWRVPLTFESDDPTVEVQTEFQLRVVDFLGEPVADATISRVDGMRVGRTDTDGYADLSVTTETGTVEFVASKQSEKDLEFVDAETTVTVEPKTTELRFRGAVRNPVAGESVRVRVVDGEDNPRENVTVEPEIGEAAKTNTDGYAEPTVDGTGAVTLTARRSDTPFEEFTETGRTVDVRPQTTHLRFAVTPDTVTPDTMGRYQVVDGDGDPVADATVGFEDTTVTATTGSAGWARLQTPRITPGETVVTATKRDTQRETFTDARRRVDVVEREVELSVAVPDPTPLTSPTTITVTDDDSNPVDGARVTAEGQTATTNPDGEATLSFGPGPDRPVKVTASKDGPTGVTFTDAADETEVVRERTSLSVTAAPESVTVGESVTCRVEDGDGAPVADATVRFRGDEAATDENGEVEFDTDTAGRVRVVARKRDTSRRVFEDGDTTTIQVDRVEESLVLSLPEGKITAFEPQSFTVEDSDGRPVAGATLAVGGERAETDENGEATVEFDTPGDQTVRARKDDTAENTYEEDRVTVSVHEPPKSVNLVDIPATPSAGTDATVSVRDHRGEPVSGAVVRAVSRQADCEDRTNDNGVASIKFDEPGYYQLTATHGEYEVFDEERLRVTD